MLFKTMEQTKHGLIHEADNKDGYHALIRVQMNVYLF
jgi:hypothetical protein